MDSCEILDYLDGVVDRDSHQITTTEVQSPQSCHHLRHAGSVQVQE